MLQQKKNVSSKCNVFCKLVSYSLCPEFPEKVENQLNLCLGAVVKVR